MTSELEQPVTVIELFQLRSSQIELWSNGILFIKLMDNIEIQLEDSKEQYEFLRSRFDGENRYRILVEPGRYTSISREAREFSSTPEKNKMTAATAVIVKSLAHRLVINFLINFTQKQTMKMRMFESKEKAIEWLRSIKA